MKMFKTLAPLYYTAQADSPRLEKIMHQALALMIYDNVQNHRPNLNMLMYFQEWLKDRYYHRKSALQTALLLRKYFRQKRELETLQSAGIRFWQRQKLGYRLYRLEHQYISVSDVLNYSCYLFVGCRCGSQEDFFEFLKDILLNPDLYFEN